MNVEQVLEQYRQRAGFDGFAGVTDVTTQTIFPSGTDRPAWRDPDSPGGWFVLPPGWDWDEYDLAFWNEGLQLFVGQNLHDGKTVDLLDASGSYISKHPTAPAAFRAAMEYLEKDGAE